MELKKEGKEALKVIDDLVKENVGKAGYKSEFTPRQVLDISRQLSDEVKWNAKDTAVDPVKKQFTEKGKKAIAEAGMNWLASVSPEIKSLNERAAARLDLMKAIENTINLEVSKDPVSFADKVLMIKSIGLAVVSSALRVPSVKARLAFAIQKGAQYQARIASKAVPYTTGEIIRYNQRGEREQ